ncbi:S9 family peptidase [Flaviaesturariibacter amylovorans]|uniref:S9 family peptidase n=1 Tax=Flaviaesturariibacter amylovorans TaxID=1084520 RepID=A0ABP8G961_9BACT
MKPSLLLAGLLCLQFPASAQQLAPPVAQKVARVFNEHGRQRTDPYYWLSNPKDSNVLNHLHAENAYVEAYLKPTETLRKQVQDELVARIPGRDQSLPVLRNGYWYFSRYEDKAQYPLILRRKEGNPTEEVLLNVPELAKPFKLYQLGGAFTAPDNRHYAYAVDTAGDRRALLFVKDLATGALLPDRIGNTTGNYAWGTDSRTLYYVLNDHTVRGYKVMRHRLGADPATDETLFTEKDSTFRVRLSTGRNNKYIFINSNATNSSEAWYIDASDPAARPVVIQPRTDKLEYDPRYYEGDVFHILTNKDAKNHKVVTVPIAQPGVANWKDLVPGNDKTFIEGFGVLNGYYLLQARENGLSQVRYFDRVKKKWQNIPFGQEDFVVRMSLATDDAASDSIRYTFTSLSTPSAEYSYNLRTGARTLLKQQAVGGGFDASLYETKRIWSTSRDGVKVPLSVVYRKDRFKKDGSNPLLLYAYGSYGANTDPYFNPSVISLLDRGVTYVIAHIRGGQELGRDWFEQGRILNKKNTFNDYVDAADHLVKEKYTSTDRIFANGVSAGGMLMGAVVNQRPELFRGVIAEVPWMDVVTDMFNTDLPLTTLEYDQWGDPNKKEHYDYMLSWSPQDNIKPARYPAILATGGLNDTQVPYYSPAKWVAKIREHNSGTNPVLFQVNMSAGHGGASGRYERQKLTATKYAFLLNELGWNEQTKTYSGIKKTF